MAKIPVPTPLIDTLAELDETATQLRIPKFARNDIKLVLDFLKQYDGNKATFEAYRREVERLLQWAWLIAKKSLLNLRRQELQEYIKFCLSPPISWIGTKRAHRFIGRGGIRRANPLWRPFVATITKQYFLLHSVVFFVQDNLASYFGLIGVVGDIVLI